MTISSVAGRNRYADCCRMIVRYPACLHARGVMIKGPCEALGYLKVQKLKIRSVTSGGAFSNVSNIRPSPEALQAFDWSRGIC